MTSVVASLAATVVVTLSNAAIYVSAIETIAQSPRATISGKLQSFCGAKPSANDLLLNPQLSPRDDAARRRDFLAFRNDLRAAVARRDRQAILRAVDPRVRVDFGDGGGIEDFKSLMNRPGETFWDKFAWALDHGGRFRTPTDFDAPYTFAAWPGEFDPLLCSAVTASRVRVREAPSTSARIVAHVDFAIVDRSLNDRDNGGWTHVRLASGESGYIASTYLRSPTDYRALFTFKEGRWWLVAFVAGD